MGILSCLLYPDIYQCNHMGNFAVFENLMKSGDELEPPREVKHWLYFKNMKMLKQFVQAIKKHDFSLADESVDVEEDGRYLLSISRIDSVNIASINEVTDMLVELSETYDGDYDGWETVVIHRSDGI
ncbi:ribonuclease E inhibitor RraB [Peribacillus simplex]|nr:ribonuclease E inhibitor RraB [Peribacillus simplex]